MISTKIKNAISVVLKDSSPLMVDVTFYRGYCDSEAEQVDTFLEMCIKIADSLNLDCIVDVCTIAQVLEDNGHAPDCIMSIQGQREKAIVPDWKGEVLALYAEGKRVQGIKVCRAATGWGLKASLTYCDANFWRPTS